MATISEPFVDYPSSDGKPMAETPIHRENMTDVIAMLEDWFQADSQAYVSGNMFMYYVRGDKHRHVSPDVFVARGIDKAKYRPYYLVWEDVAPQFVIEMTSASTRKEDVRDKFNLYEQTLKVEEYFLFDPDGDYLKPNLQGYRLIDGRYARIEPVDGRLTSEVTGLHLERDGIRLRLYDPVQKRRLPTRAEARDRALAEAQSARALQHAALAQCQSAQQALDQQAIENEQLRQRIRDLESKFPPPN